MSFIRPVCQALVGKKSVRGDDVCRAMSGKQMPQDEELMEPIMTGEGIVPLAGAKNVVDCEQVNGSSANGTEAQATPPMEFSVKLSADYPPGEKVRVNGPHGPIEIQPPAESQPGSSLRYRLAPEPEFRCQVPPGARPGNYIRIQRPDGAHISVTVPPGHEPGDSFEVTPPALMVRMPQGVQAGAPLVFKDLEGNWFRAPAPANVEPEAYFAVRLPALKRQK